MIDNPDDVKLVKQLISGLTLTSKESQHGMLDALRYVKENDVKGDVVECGVWRGGNIILARNILPDRRCWLYDTFTGMTMPGDDDKRRSGKRAKDAYNAHLRDKEPWCMASLAEVRQIFEEKGVLDDELCRFVEGDVLETFSVSENLPEHISLLRLDTDWYASTKLELEVLYPLLVSGGVLIIDDYGHWLGCRRAVDEFFSGQDVTFKELDYTAVMLVKP